MLLPVHCICNILYSKYVSSKLVGNRENMFSRAVDEIPSTKFLVVK